MRSRPDTIDRMLEHWASWRMTEEIYTGTGPSSLVHFSEPIGTTAHGTRLLYSGRSNRTMSALNSDLITHLGQRPVNSLLMLYGLPGNEIRKMRQYGISSDNVRTLRKQARIITRNHLPTHLNLRDTHEPV